MRPLQEKGKVFEEYFEHIHKVETSLIPVNKNSLCTTSKLMSFKNHSVV